MSKIVSSQKGRSLSRPSSVKTIFDESEFNPKKPELSNSSKFSKARKSVSPYKKLSETHFSPIVKNPESSKKLGFSRYNSSKLISEIFSSSLKSEEQEIEKSRVTLIESSQDLSFELSTNFKSSNHNKNRPEKISTEPFSAYSSSPKIIQSSLDEFPKPVFLKSDIDSVRVAEKISKEFSVVYRKNKSNMLQKEKLIEEIQIKESEIMKYKQFVHDIINKVNGLKIKIAAKDSDLSSFSNSSYSQSKSIFDLKTKVKNDLDLISSIIDKVFFELYELNDVKQREQETRKSLNDLNERENLLLAKIETQKSKNFELASIQIENERNFDKKEFSLNREKNDLQEKINNLEASLNKISREKEDLEKCKNGYFVQTQDLIKHSRKLEFDLSKTKELANKYQTEIQVFKEKLNNKEINEELLKIKLKSAEKECTEDQRHFILNEKIEELEKILKSKNSEILELKYKDCLSSPKASLSDEAQLKTGNFKNRINEITSLSEGPSEKLIKSQQKEIKVLKISLDVLQRENSNFVLMSQKIGSLEQENEQLSAKLSLFEEKVLGLEEENKRLQGKQTPFIDCERSAERCSKDKYIFSKIQRGKNKDLIETKQNNIEENAGLKELIEIKESLLEKLKNDLKETQNQLGVKNFQIDSLGTEINRLKSSVASNELEIAYFHEKEEKSRDRIEEYIQDINKLKLESSKIKDEVFKQSQELLKKDYQIEELNSTEKSLKDQIISKVNETQKLLKEIKETQSAFHCQKEENLKISQEISKKNSQISALASSEKLLKSRLDEQSEEIENLLKEVENQKRNFEEIFAGKCEIEKKLASVLNEMSRIEEENLVLRQDALEKDKELSVYLDHEKKVSNDIEEIEKDLKKQKRKSLRPEEEIKFVNEERFRLKSLLVYKDVQIKLLKDKLSGECELNKNLKRGKSLLEKNR